MRFERRLPVNATYYTFKNMESTVKGIKYLSDKNFLVFVSGELERQTNFLGLLKLLNNYSDFFQYSEKEQDESISEWIKEKEIYIDANINCIISLSGTVGDKKYIITDPCYIMDDKQYQKICDDGCDFEGQDFPLESKRESDGEKITFYTIEGTPNGDGSMIFRGQDIGVDAGMLCIAFCEKGWSTERSGARFSSLEDAKVNLPRILKHF